MEQTDEPKKDIDGPELMESHFTFHDFTDTVGDVTFTCQIMKMQDSYFVYIGNSEDGTMDTLTYSFLSAYDNLPVSTRLMGPVADPQSALIAAKLTKLTKTPIYVSFNVNVSGRFTKDLEQKVVKEFTTHVLEAKE